MKSKKSPADKGVERLAAIVEAHLDQLSPADRAEKVHAFHEVVSKIGVLNGSTARNHACDDGSRCIECE
ncbi:MAG TPA: hypothetical protein VN924_04105 [Bryobacteraceae bacterium]|jgi:hypothetical protein|nr:hypothetical protein [Bryobacteraceae bacterium]